MKVLLINPPFLPKFSRSSRSPAVTKSATIYYPLWLAHATGLLEKHGHEVLLIDFPAECKELNDYRQKIVDFSPDMIVCDTSTPSIETDVRSLEIVKSRFLLPPIGVIVGTHPSALPEKTIMLSHAVDVVARGEYDWTLCYLASRPDKMPYIPGISFRQNGSIVHNPARPYSENLDDLPFVSSVYKKHLNIANYFYAHWILSTQCKNGE